MKSDGIKVTVDFSGIADDLRSLAEQFSEIGDEMRAHAAAVDAMVARGPEAQS